LVTAATTVLLYQPRMIGEVDCGEIGRMKIGRGNRSSRRNCAIVTLNALDVAQVGKLTAHTGTPNALPRR
jgi:hypothetical protein